MPFLFYNEKRIYFEDSGLGNVIVLLHGFTESLKIWEHFVKILSTEFRIVAIDLPGHGRSESVGTVHSMELFAEVVKKVITVLNISKCLMIGHSMGGYVTLAFASKYPEMLKGIGIFHSHSFADSPEDKKTRDRTIHFVRQDKFSFITQFIPGLFPEEVQAKYAPEIENLVNEAWKMSKDAVTAALEGMKIRSDQTKLLKSINLPVLFILGLKDTRAPLSRLWEMVSLPAHSESLILKNVGHMGFIEAPDETLQTIRHFAMKIFSGS